MRPSETFRKLVKDSQLPIKAYVLGKLGLSHHEVRVLVNEKKPFALRHEWNDNSSNTSVGRLVEPHDLWILNCSLTTPAVVQVDVIVDCTSVLKAFPALRLLLNEPIIKHRINYLGTRAAGDDDTPAVDVRTIPVLSKGNVLHLNLSESWSFDFVIAELYKQMLDSEELFENRVKLRGREKYEHFDWEKAMTSLDWWIGITLDSDEILPFRWMQSQERFVPEFETLGIEVRK